MNSESNRENMQYHNYLTASDQSRKYSQNGNAQMDLDISR